MASHSTTICVVLVFVCTVYIGGECLEDGPSKRLVLGEEEDYATILARLNNLTNKVNTLEKAQQSMHHPVSFLAEITHSVAGQNHQIIFDDVKFNLGNGYHSTHGNFIAPANGLYQFTIYACSLNSHVIALELTVNTAVVGKVLAGDQNYHACNTGVFLRTLSAGDDVYVQHKTTGDYLYMNSAYGRPSFSGVLLYTM